MTQNYELTGLIRKDEALGALIAAAELGGDLRTLHALSQAFGIAAPFRRELLRQKPVVFVITPELVEGGPQ